MLLDMAASAAVVSALVGRHPLLPAAELNASTRGVTVHLHTGFSDFEAWREALHVPSTDVEFHYRESGTTMRAETVFGGTRVELIGYSGPVPQTAQALKAVA